MSTLIEDARSGLAPFDPFHPDFLENPYRFYARYREEDPVHWGVPPEPMAPGCWYIMRHDDNRFVIDDQRFCIEIANAIPPELLPPLPEPFRPFFEQTGDWFLFRDPPDHTRLKRLVSLAFTRKQVEQLEPRIRQVANDLLDRAGDGQPLDVIHDYAASLPVIIIADLLGMPLDNREQLRHWSKAILAGMDVRQSEEAPRLLAAATTAVLEFSAHLRKLFEEKRNRPDEHLMSRLINVADAGGDQLSDRELVATCIMLFFTGHETTVNLLGNGLLALLNNPDQLALLRQRPELINSAVEEMARYDSSAQMTFRFATEDVELRGKRIGRGDPIAIVLGAANRDPNVFPNPDKFDITRQDNPHIAFGSGRHHCLGASLARLETRIAIPTLLERIPDIQLLTDKLEWNRSIGLRGLKSLPVGSPAAALSSAAH